MDQTSNQHSNAPATEETQKSTQECQLPSSGYAQAGYPAPSGYSGHLQSGYENPNQTPVDLPLEVLFPKSFPHKIEVSKTPKIESSPPTYKDRMGDALFAAYCCFYPAGKLAIRRARAAQDAMSRGDLSTAIRHSEAAKSLIHTSKVIGVTTLVAVTITLVITLPILYA